jgi:glycosidase
VLDWVGNHTAWDSPLAREHPDYYLRDAAGHFQPPTGFDWTDVIQLDFSNPAVLEMEYDAMAYWIRGFGVDGFRCDFATGVPTSFWDALTARLRELRPDLFMLAESELPQHQLRAFNTSYAFEMMHAFNDVAAGRAPVSRIDDTLARSRVELPDGGSLIYYTTNHDENSWQGTAFERLGGGANTFAVLSFVLDGIPLIYDGQEVGLNHRLKFFERDPIDWKPNPAQTAFYQKLCALRRSEPALATGAAMRRIPTTLNAALYAVLREQGEHRLVALLNLTGEAVKAEAYDPALRGPWRDALTGEALELAGPLAVDLPAWGWRILVSVAR